MSSACVFSIDDAYVMPFQVFFHSLHTTDSLPPEIPIYILHTSDLTTESINKLTSFLSIYGRLAEFIDASSAIPDRLHIPEGTYYSPATYYRLFVTNILPQHITHIVYLDVDLIAVRSIVSLFSFTFDDPIAAVDHLSPYHSIRIGRENADPYFQAGILLIALNKWRDLNLVSTFISIINNHWDSLKCVDQDVLNIALRDQWTRLPLGFNIEENAIRNIPFDWIEEHIKIAHFTGKNKPWNSYKPLPYVSHWDASYKAVFGIDFDREQFKPPLKLKTRIKQKLMRLTSILSPKQLIK
jgi:lipopolysaccharide biosynthesis glycosyltransferase